MASFAKPLYNLFSASNIPTALPPELRKILQSFVDERDGTGKTEDLQKTNLELEAIWERYVVKSPQRLDAFIGVLRELQSVLVRSQNVLRWWKLALKPAISHATLDQVALGDAEAFLVGVMVLDEQDANARQRRKTSKRISTELLDVYMENSRALQDGEDFTVTDRMQVAQQLQTILTSFGRKRPRELFHLIDDLVLKASTRLQALTLLSSFLRHETPHLYLVTNTPLVEHLLKCLMNDSSTTILSVALSSLIMLMPHIPGSLTSHLPQLFLVYSRMLCWEKFSELSDEGQRNLVTDDRVSHEREDDNQLKDVGVDASWEKARPPEGEVESHTPELMTYFTYLYGLYPLNFINYIRKPRRYLKDVDFPDADSFDLDQAIIRARTEQFREMHLLHPNFYNMTAEEELNDPKWPKMDPADVVGECLFLSWTSRISSQLQIPQAPPPTTEPEESLPLPPTAVANLKLAGQISPSASHTSLGSGSSWLDTQSAAVAHTAKLPSSNLLDQHIAQPSGDLSSELSQQRSLDEQPAGHIQMPIAHLQRQLMLLRNELNFEKWHKAQISTHVGQIFRQNVKQATVEAETLTLINANRALKKQLEQVKKAREATIKDSALTRKQANSLEANLNERFNKFKVEQEKWQADGDELQRLRSEMQQYRDLLVATEAREFTKAHQLEMAQRDVTEMEKVKRELQDAQHRLHEYEFKEFEYKTTVKQRDILARETEALKMKLRNMESNKHVRRSSSVKR